MSSSEFSVVLSGDCILNGRVSDVSEPRFLDLVRVIQGADVGITHLETLIHDYVGPEVYPAAEAGWTWMRSPQYITEELKWLGIDAVSHASNHAFDYSVGGLRSTWSALDRADIQYAGTGEDLAAARSPAFVWRGGRKVALISMSSSVPRSARAGAAGPDVRGRPGINPLGFWYAVDQATWAEIRALSTRLGRWVQEVGDGEWLVHDPGLHNSGTRYFVDEAVSGALMVADQDDETGNLASVSDAAARSDITVVHIHNHEWDPVRGLAYPPEFIVNFAHKCIRSGASVVLAQGSHAPLRGVELFEGGVIFYDPGELFRMSQAVTKLPYEFHRRYSSTAALPGFSTAEVFKARARSGGPKVVSPQGGYRTGKVEGGFLAEVLFDEANRVSGVRLHPFDRKAAEGERGGLPRAVGIEEAARILGNVQELSDVFHTRVQIDGTCGVLKPM